VTTFTARSLYPWEKNLLVPIGKEVDFGFCGEQKRIPAPADKWISSVQLSSPVAMCVCVQNALLFGIL